MVTGRRGRIRRRRRLVAAHVLLLLAVAGTASARWTSSGTGVGTGTTGTAMPVTLTPGVPTGDLFPGGRADVLLTVTNPNRSPMRIGALVLDPRQGLGGFGVDAAHAGCAASALSYTRQTNGGTGWNVAGRSGSVDGTLAIRLPNAVAMSVDAANACQGARIDVYLAVGS